jgi:hypothetical protein
MDFDDHLILVYVVCDECLKSLNHKDDIQTKMTSAEVMTTALISALYQYGNLSRTRLVLASLNYIPNMLSISRLCRKWKKIPDRAWEIVLHYLATALCKNKKSRTCIIDSFPMPACQPYKSKVCKLYHGKEYLGYCCSKKLKYYGLKIHVLVDETGFIEAFLMTPASVNDVKAFSWMNLDLPGNSKIYGDKAYTSYLVEDLLLELDNIQLLPLRKSNLKRQHNYKVDQKIKRTRPMVETSISAIQSLFPKAICARTPRGFELKIVMFLIAKNFRDLFRQVSST